MEYISKIWLSTIFVTPFVYWPIQIILSDYWLSELDKLPLMVVVSMFAASILSLPTFAILFFLGKWMEFNQCKPKTIKSTFAIVGTVGILITVASSNLPLFFSTEGFILCGSYCLVTAAASLFFNTNIEKR